MFACAAAKEWVELISDNRQNKSSYGVYVMRDSK